MGLDLYLRKTKRVPGVTIEEINILDLYFDYLNREAEYKDSQNIEKIRNYSMEEWCGISESDVRKDIVDMYKDEFKRRYLYGYLAEDGFSGWNSLWQEIGYWRKANAIHKWFVDNVQNGVDDCDYYEVSKEQLKELLDRIREVLADRDKAELLLPTQSGFFFGSTEYDKWYFMDLENGEKMLEEILAETKFDEELVIYHASW